jgi:hypothetical protein
MPAIGQTLCQLEKILLNQWLAKVVGCKQLYTRFGGLKIGVICRHPATDGCPAARKPL